MDSFTFARPFCEECTERQSLFIINFCLVTWNLNGGLRKNWQKSSSNKKKRSLGVLFNSFQKVGSSSGRLRQPRRLQTEEGGASDPHI